MMENIKPMDIEKRSFAIITEGETIGTDGGTHTTTDAEILIYMTLFSHKVSSYI